MKKVIKSFIYILLLGVIFIPTVVIAATPLGGENAGLGGSGGSGGPCRDICVQGWGARVTLVYYDYDGTKNVTPIASYLVYDTSNDNEWTNAFVASSDSLKVWEGKAVPSRVLGRIQGVSGNSINPSKNGAAFAAWVEDTTNGVFGYVQPQGLKQPGCGTPTASRPTECDLAAKFGLTLYYSNSSSGSRGGINGSELGKYYIAVEPFYETYRKDDGEKEYYPPRGKGTGTLRTARQGGDGKYLRSIGNPKGGVKNRYCDADGQNCKYYVGPNDEIALVGTTNHPYKLVTMEELGSYRGTPKNKAAGIAFYYLRNQCRESCGMLGGDAKFACAERVCDVITPYDAKNPNAKAACISECVTNKESCKSKFNVDQVTEITAYCKKSWSKDAEGYDSEKACLDHCLSTESNTCIKDDPHKETQVVSNVGIMTICGSVDGGYKICDDSEPDTIPINARKYYTVSCIETSKFDYLDTRKQPLIPGEGLYYDVKLDGNKLCKIFFDIKSWQFDYASVHSKDIDAAERLRILREYLEDFNDAYAPKNANQVATIAEFKKLLKLSDDYIDYDVKRVTVNAKFEEIIDGDSKTSRTYNLVREQSMEEIDAVTNIDQQVIKLVNQHSSNPGGQRQVNYYQTNSTRKVNYLLKGQCLATDGHGLSYEVEEGQNCNDNTTPKRLYYTSLKAMTKGTLPPGMEHKVITNAAITDAGNTAYVSSTDTCTFEFKCTDDECPPPEICDPDTDPECPPSKGGKCVITIKNGQRVPGVENGYTGDVEVELGMEIDGIPNTDIIAAGISIEQIFNPTGVDWTKIINDTSTECSNKPIMVYGKIKTETLGDIECEAAINFVSDCHDLDCEIVSEDNDKKLYRITATGSLAGSALYFYRINGGEEIKIVKDANNGKYFIHLDKLSDKEVAAAITGIVKANGKVAYCSANGRCTDYFQKTEEAAISEYCKSNWTTDLAGYTNPKDCEDSCKEVCTDPNGCGDGAIKPRSCINEFNKDDVKEIKEYCATNWSTDLGQYKNSEDCYIGCTSVKAVCNVSVIPNPSYESIYQYCSTNATLKDAFGSVENCATMCCKDTGICSGSGYVYRPVSQFNPFPDSYLDSASLEKSRDVGANWYGKQDLITKKTAEKVVNGDEYVIVLDSNSIKKIRQSNANYNKELIANKKEGNVYLDYVYSDSTKASVGNDAVYVSKFIHDKDAADGGFNQYFEIINRKPNN